MGEIKVLAQEDLINTLQEKVGILEGKIETKEAEATLNTEVSVERTFVESLSSKVEEHEKKIRELSRELIPPVAYICAYKGSTTVQSSYIAYDSIFYSRTNEMTQEGGLNLVTGEYTAPWPGTYIITYSLYSRKDAGDPWVEIYLHKNGGRLTETVHFSSFIGTSGGAYDQGGRTAILHLDRGETVALECVDCSGEVAQVLFCVYLAEYDAI